MTIRFKIKHGGEWGFAVRRDKYACVFRPKWFELGRWEFDPVIGLTEPGESAAAPKVHFRLVVGRTDTDSGEQFFYEVRLKVDTREQPTLGARVVSALRAGGGFAVPDRGQFTRTLKTTRTLPGLSDDPDDVPDSVVQWFEDQTEDLIKLLDADLRKG